MKQPSTLRPAATALALALSASLAFPQQAPVRSATSPRSAGVGFSGGAAPGGAATPTARNPVAALPGTGTAAAPVGAPSPSGLASPLPFPAGIPSTAIAAPGTSAAITGPTTVSPSLAGSSTAGGVTSSTRGVVNVPGSTASATVQPIDAGVIGAAGNAAAVLDPNGAASAGNAGSTVSIGTPGAPVGSVGVDGNAANVAQPTVVGGAGSLTGGVPSVMAVGAAAGPLTPLQVAQFFQRADTNADGLLSRAEALRLQLATMSFDDMDRNRDGSVSRSEYDDSLR